MDAVFARREAEAGTESDDLLLQQEEAEERKAVARGHAPEGPEGRREQAHGPAVPAEGVNPFPSVAARAPRPRPNPASGRSPSSPALLRKRAPWSANSSPIASTSWAAGSPDFRAGATRPSAMTRRPSCVRALLQFLSSRSLSSTPSSTSPRYTR